MESCVEKESAEHIGRSARKAKSCEVDGEELTDRHGGAVENGLEVPRNGEEGARHAAVDAVDVEMGCGGNGAYARGCQRNSHKMGKA